MGCAPAVAFGVAHPRMTASLVLYWPVGGAHYRINSHQRFADHLNYVRHHGLAGVATLVTAERKPFNQDPRGGPWATVIATDPTFAASYVRQEVNRYFDVASACRESLFDRDTAPGARPEDLINVDAPALIVPGRDRTHATSAARYLEECLQRSEYWDINVDHQTEDSVPPRLLEFLAR
jgi:hypothetical protein